MKKYFAHDFRESSTPSTPPTNFRKIYPKADGWYDKDSAGVETKIGGIAGSGTTNYIPKFTAGTILGNSVISEVSGLIGINKATPTASLEIVGAGATSATYALKVHNSTGTNNGLVVRNDGWVGINNATQISSTESLGVKGFILSMDTTTANYTRIGTDASTSGVNFTFGAFTHKILISSSGVTYSSTGTGVAYTYTDQTYGTPIFYINTYSAADSQDNGHYIKLSTYTSNAGHTLRNSSPLIFNSRYWNGTIDVVNQSIIKDVAIDTSANHYLSIGGSLFVHNNSNIGINGVTTFGTSSAGVFAQANGTAPTTNISTQYHQYCLSGIPYFKTGGGDVISLFKGAALTTTLTTLTQTGTFTPDYAVQALTNITPYGFATLDEAETTLSVILNLQARVNQLESRLQASGQIS